MTVNDEELKLAMFQASAQEAPSQQVVTVCPCYRGRPDLCPLHAEKVRKPYESPKVTDINEVFRERLRLYFEMSTKTSFGLGDIYEGIDKVLLGR